MADGVREDATQCKAVPAETGAVTDRAITRSLSPGSSKESYRPFAQRPGPSNPETATAVTTRAQAAKVLNI